MVSIFEIIISLCNLFFKKYNINICFSVTNLNVKRTKNEMNPLSREKSCSLENLINKHSFFSK